MSSLPPAPVEFKFLLYVADDTLNSMVAVANLKALCAARLPARCEIEIVDVFKEPERALADHVHVTPTLIRLAPSPVLRTVGALRQEEERVACFETGADRVLKAENVRSWDGANDEVASLITTLHETEQRLEELTGGEVDTVSDQFGRPYLLRRAQEELRLREADKQAAILDALPAHIALLDGDGVIVSANQTWRRSAIASFLRGPADGIGLNYLDVCDGARGPEAADARRTADGIRAVLAGGRFFSIEYPCHLPTEQRWFLTTVTPLSGALAHGVVVMNLDITERRQAEDARHATQKRLRDLIDGLGASMLVGLMTPDGIVVEVNSPALTTVGLKPEDVLGKPLADSRWFAYSTEVQRQLRDAIARGMRGEASRYDVKIRGTGDGFIDVDFALNPVRNETGRVVFLVPSGNVITERKRAEIALRESHEKFQQLADNISDAFWIRSADFGEVQYLSPAFETIWGRSVASLRANPHEWTEFVFAEDRPRVRNAFAAMCAERPRLDIEYRIVRPDGAVRWVRARAFQIRDSDATLVRHVGIVTDVTERRQAEDARRTSEERFRSYFELGLIGMAITSPEKNFLEINHELCRILGYGREELFAKNWAELTHPDDLAEENVLFGRVLAGEIEGYTVEKRFLRKDGGVVHAIIAVKAARRQDGTISYVVGLLQDITVRKEAETELQWKTAFLEAQVASSLDGILVVDEFGKKSLQNQRLADLFGIPQHISDDKDDRRQRLWVAEVTTQPRQFAEKVAYLNSKPDEISRDEIELTSGATLERYSAPVIGKEGKYYGRIWTFRDITERRRSMEALRASERRFKALFEQAAVGVAQAEAATGGFVQVNRRFADILGRSREELEHLTFAAITHPQDVAFDVEKMRQLQAGEIREYGREKRYLRKDGSSVWVSLTVSAMWAPGDAPGQCIAVVQDITERKRFDEHFLQAQKMEALGQFSGGVAHDFNNILATISGYTELSRMLLRGHPEVRDHLGSVLKASVRAADLVQQILTFSRQQPQERQTIQLERVVEESIKLLRATIPSTIPFDVSISADAPTVLGNPNQIHQVMTNLGINAWHAMQDGPGRLKITLEKWRVDEAHATAQPRLRPGGYARVSVSDTGRGMDAATVRRIFEPFFTTKPVGQGTGLGLAVVHGIMDAHDGAVTVYSQPGEGTVFHLYFPAHSGEINADPIAEGPTPHGRGEAVLVVDDEEMIASMIQKTLARLDYAAESATDPAAALALIQADPHRFKLVLSDQTMPGMTGLAFATRLREIRPDLPVLLMTGFSASLTPERLEAAGVRQVLPKPFTVQSLGSALHAIFAAQPR